MIAMALFLALGDDPITGKLNAAKSAHKTELEALKESTLKWFAKQEAAVKRGNDKKAVKELGEAQSLFENNIELPPGLPANLQKKYAAAAATLEKSFQSAVKEYRQSKNLPKASEVDKEWMEFRIDGPGNAQPEIRDGASCLIVACCSKMAMTVDATDSPKGAFVVQRQPDDLDEQQRWMIVRRSVAGQPAYAFLHGKYKLPMQVSNWSRGNGAEITLWPGDTKSVNETWYPLHRGGWLTLTGANGRLLLAIPEGTKNAGARLIQWSASNADDQRFKIIPVRAVVK